MKISLTILILQLLEGQWNTKKVETVTPAVLLILTLTLTSKRHSWVHRDLHIYIMTLNFGSSDKLLGAISWVTDSSFLSAATEENVMNALEGLTGKFIVFHLCVTLSNFCLQTPYPLGNILQIQKEQYLGKEQNCSSHHILEHFIWTVQWTWCFVSLYKMILFMCSCSFLSAHWCPTLLPCTARREQKYPAIFKFKA